MLIFANKRMSLVDQLVSSVIKPLITDKNKEV